MEVFYEKDADLKHLKNKKVGIIGYGIQGRAQALNMRDSGIEVLIGNRNDDYIHRAAKENFQVYPIEKLVSICDIIFFLIPDDAQKNIFDEFILPNLKTFQTYVFAHGYSLRFGLIEFPKNINVLLIAPRFPGKPIREYFLNGGGVPVFYDVIQYSSKNANDLGLALCKAIGATKAGVFKVSYKEETDIDLFIEQYLIPTIIKSIEIGYKTLIDAGYNHYAVVSELFASGELGEVIKQTSIEGLYNTFKNHASPTCQFGISCSVDNSLNEASLNYAKFILDEIRNGNFSESLKKEGRNDYPILNKFFNDRINNELNEKYCELNSMIKFRNVEDE